MERILNIAQNNFVNCPNCCQKFDLHPSQIPFEDDETDFIIECPDCGDQIILKNENGWLIKIEAD